MSSHIRPRCAGVPDFGETVRRGRLLRLAGALGSGSLLIAGPGGYGKSVTAAQIAGELFDAALWIDASELSPDLRAILAVVATRLGARLPTSGAEGALSKSCTDDELLLAIGNLVRARSEHAFCAVIDNCHPGVAESCVLELGKAIRRPAPSRTLLAVTSRCDDLDQAPAGCCVLGPADLRMSPSEARSMVEAVADRALSEEESRQLVEATRGQPAMLAVVARHWPADGASDLVDSADLRGLLLQLARGADTECRRAIYAAALLVGGTVSDVEAVGGDTTARALLRASEYIPLLRLGPSRGRNPEFAMHDLAVEVYASGSFEETVDAGPAMRQRALAHLAACGRPARALELLLEHEDEGQLAVWIGEYGVTLVSMGHLDLVDAALARLGILGSLQPRVLLVAARVASEREDFEQAVRRARAAQRLAAEDGDEATQVEALALAGRCDVSRGRLAEAASSFKLLLQRDDEGLASELRSFAFAVMGAVAAAMGDAAGVDEGVSCSQQAMLSGSLAADTTARVLNLHAIASLIGGRDLKLACAALRQAAALEPVSSRTREYVLGNHAGCLVECGQLAAARRVLSDLEEHCRRHGRPEPVPAFWAIRACLRLADADADGACRLVRESVSQCSEQGDETNAHDNLVYSSLIQMCVGDAETAVADAEEALELTAALGLSTFAERAAVQMRAGMLAMGDVDAARHAATSRDWAVGHHTLHVEAMARMVVAETMRLDGRAADAVAELAPSRDYLATGSLNFFSAVYVRTFPGLLGLLAAAMGPKDVPHLLLKLLPPETVAEGMPLARAVLGTEDWQALARRLRYKEAAPEALPSVDGSAPCTVRLFGGFEATVPAGPVSARAWRKRKAQILFAMLVAKRGQQVARDVIADYLWPELDEPTARSNFYVTWSAMKAALSPEVGRGKPCPYAESARGVCRLRTEVVRSDLDDFDEAVSNAAAAERAGDPQLAVASYERLLGTYRGELMSADVYDDWFTPMRDRYRHAFGDAVVTAAELCEEAGNAVAGLRFARAGLMHDPWREDLYQAALRLQIAAGQRSAAVETYLACRSKLVDDLGLDPSSETMRLYEQVLAMEEAEEPDTPSADRG